MDNLEKVDKLRERANVSYEEAKAALEANGWDLLDAMVYLEKAGKTEKPEQTNYSTSYEEQKQYVRVEEEIKAQEEKTRHTSRTLGDALRRFFRVCRDNKFTVTKDNNTLFQLPILALLVILLFTWKILIPVMIVALFFGCRYHLEGVDDLKGANDFMESAGNAAESFKEGFKYGGSRES